MNKEATARIKINKMLEDAGWLLLDSKFGKANVGITKVYMGNGLSEYKVKKN